MTLQEIVAQCAQQQQIMSKPDAPVVFVVRGKWGRRTTKTLFPHGPSGKILADRLPNGKKNRLVVLFKADEVLAHIDKLLDRMQSQELKQATTEAMDVLRTHSDEAKETQNRSKLL